MSDVRRERQLGNITPNLQRFEASKAVDWLDAIKRQVCPFCNEGPFVVVAHHVNRIHGINRLTLRDMLGLGTHEVICDPVYAAARHEHTQRLHSQGKLNAGTPPEQRGGKRRKTRVRSALYARQGPIGAARLRSPEVIRKRDLALVAGVESRRQQRLPRDNEIIARLVDSKDSTRTIAAALGVGRTTVRRIASEHGIDLAERASHIAKTDG